MHSKDILAEELRKAGLHNMAIKAANGVYHDFLSPLPDPALELDRDLVQAGTKEAMAIRQRHHNGEFDATLEESEAWAESAEGQEAMHKLMEDK